MSTVDQLIQLLHHRQTTTYDKHKHKHQQHRAQSIIVNTPLHQQPPWKSNHTYIQPASTIREETSSPSGTECSTTGKSTASTTTSPPAPTQEVPPYLVDAQTIKVPASPDEFMKYSSRDKHGHLPYLYESDLQRISRIRSTLVQNRSKYASRRGYFGLHSSRLGRSQACVE